ncbi:DUF1259 domain-containing protein [Luteimonas suaedae]|uniref:DUF1259 domain-containing protein n=1 Tax=Luteimonas suaedae TaxID=2605430 RepID=UPI0011EE7240|nr:DUF1259 domain-containing protein [Luteimonas suaedae]
MHFRQVRSVLFVVSILACAAAAAPALAAEPVDPQAIAEASGAKPTVADDGVVRIGWSRQDVEVTVDGMVLPPAAGLGSWAAFTATDAGAMVMGDTVVFQDEVDAAMDAAFAHGLEVTGLHNHFFYDSPKVYFMHIGGMGEPEPLAAGVKAVWEAIRAVRAARPQPASGFGGDTPVPGELDPDALAEIVGHPAPVEGGVAKITIGREGRMHGQPIAASMGLTTWAAFSGSDALAAIDGDFIMTADEVQPVLRALRKAGLHVVALHNHMTGEQPAFYFTHFWGKGPAAELARGFRSALDAQAAAADVAASRAAH